MNIRPSAPSPARTSASHPLQIAELGFDGLPGRVGVTFCPGKQGDSVFGVPWHRDLEADLDLIQAWGARTVLTLVEAQELDRLSVPDLGARVEARGMTWVHLPIPDLQPPGNAFSAAWPGLSARLKRQLTEGGRILVHCRGGLGRAGTVAACILVEMKVPPDQAIQAVRKVRPRAIETSAQEAFVMRFRPTAAVNSR